MKVILVSANDLIFCKYSMLRNDLKDYYKIFYMVKGHLEASPETVISCYDGYFKRLWLAGCNGAPLYDYEEQFETAWSHKQNGKQAIRSLNRR